MKTFDKVESFFKYADLVDRSVLIVGMVKEADQDSISFTPTTCEDWIRIPKSIIKEMSYVGRSHCAKPGEDAHTHPVAKLQVETGDHEIGSYLRILVSLASANVAPPLASRRSIALGSSMRQDCDQIGGCGQSCKDINGNIQPGIPWLRPCLYQGFCSYLEDPYCPQPSPPLSAR